MGVAVVVIVVITKSFRQSDVEPDNKITAKVGKVSA